MRDAWTDERLDDLSRHIDIGFGDVRDEIRSVRSEIESVRSEIRGEIDGVRGEIRELRKEMGSVQRTMVYGFISMTAAMLAGFGGMTALVATQL